MHILIDFILIFILTSTRSFFIHVGKGHSDKEGNERQIPRLVDKHKLGTAQPRGWRNLMEQASVEVAVMPDQFGNCSLLDVSSNFEHNRKVSAIKLKPHYSKTIWIQKRRLQALWNAARS